MGRKSLLKAHEDIYELFEWKLELKSTIRVT